MYIYMTFLYTRKFITNKYQNPIKGKKYDF